MIKRYFSGLYIPEKGAVHKACHAIFDYFWPPSPLSQILDPLKVCNTSEQKVNKQISRRMETALNNYNRYYYILNNIRCF